VLVHQKPSSVKAAKSHLRTHIRKHLENEPYRTMFAIAAMTAEWPFRRSIRLSHPGIYVKRILQRRGRV
jgi:hypothetical protein